MQTQTNPTEARKSDSYEVDTAIFFITSALRFELNVSGNVAYQTGEYVLGGTTGYTGLVESVTYDATTNTTTLVVIEPEGYFLINEVIGGLTSNVGDTLNSYEVVT